MVGRALRGQAVRRPVGVGRSRWHPRCRSPRAPGRRHSAYHLSILSDLILIFLICVSYLGLILFYLILSGEEKRAGVLSYSLETTRRRQLSLLSLSLSVCMGVLVARQGESPREQMALQEDVMVGSEQERLLLLTSMLGVAEHDLVSTQDRLNAMHQLQLEKDQELMQKERHMGSLHDVRVLPRTDASRPSHAYGTTQSHCLRSSASAVPFGGTSGPWKGLSPCVTYLASSDLTESPCCICRRMSVSGRNWKRS